MNAIELFQAIRKANLKYDHHETDLYVKVTPESTNLIREYDFRQNVTRFIEQVDKTLWYDIPFAYVKDLDK